MERFDTQKKISHDDLSARRFILDQYESLGETRYAIHKIENRIRILAESKYKINLILPRYSQLIEEAEITRTHKTIQLVEHNDYKVAVHIIPSSYKIPAHSHLNVISIVYVHMGKLEVKQLTISPVEEKFERKLKKHQTCAGLLSFRNIHSLRSLSPCIFISFRIHKKKNVSLSSHRLFSFIASCGLVLLPTSLTLNVNEVVSGEMENGVDKKLSVSPDHSPPKQLNENLVRANKLRIGDTTTQDLYEASIIYQREANKGNAIAQYWLGIMYLDGLGITDDTDEALRWVASSADQNYPPAEKLLHILLTTDEILYC